MIAIRWLAGEPRRPAAPRQPVLSQGYPYEMRWKRLGRQHQRCRIMARGAMNSVDLEFEDGFRAICSANAIRVHREKSQ